MELSVQSIDGWSLPESCHIGVRVGEVLKQGRYEPLRPYHFPQIDRPRNAKIDLYNHIGTGMVVVDPDQKTVQHIEVTSSDPAFMGKRLQVNVVNQKQVMDYSNDQQTRLQAKRSQAQQYLVKYCIEERIADAVKALLKVQPADPTGFFCDHFQANRSQAEKAENIAPIIQPELGAPPPSAPPRQVQQETRSLPQQEQKTAPQPDTKCAAQQGQSRLASDIENLRTALQDSKGTAASAASMQPLPNGCRKTPDMLRGEAFATLLKANAGGNLALEIKNAPVVPVASAPVQAREIKPTALNESAATRDIPCAPRSPSGPAPTKSRPVVQPKAKAAEPAPQLAPQSSESVAQPPANLPTGVDVMLLRQQAFDSLMKKSASGELSKILRDESSSRQYKDVTALRQKAFDALAGLTQGKETQRIACGTGANAVKAHQAATSPREAEPPQAAPPSDSNAVSSQATAIVAKPSGDSPKNGKSPKAPKSDMVLLRQQACDQILKSSANGELDKRLHDINGVATSSVAEVAARDVSAVKASAPISPQITAAVQPTRVVNARTPDTALLRQRASDTLMSYVLAGELSGMLKEVKLESSSDGVAARTLAQKACYVLVTANLSS